MKILEKAKLMDSLLLTMQFICQQKLPIFSKLHWRPAFFRTSIKFSEKHMKYSTKKVSDNNKDALYKLRSMRQEDIHQMVRLRREFTFQDSISSYEICHKVDPGAFIVVADENDGVIGFGSLKHSSDTLSTAGCLTVHPDYWKLGLAKKMIQHHLPRAESRNAVTMTEAHLIPIYVPYFPVIEKEYIIIDFEGQKEINTDYLSFENQSNTEVKHFQKEYLSAVLEFDRKVIGFDRHEDVVFSCLDSCGKTVVAISGSKCIGYGSIKLNIQGAGKVGPLYSESPSVAEAMLKKLIKSFVYGKGFAVSVPSNNFDAVKLFGKLGKTKTVNNFRLSTRKIFSLDTKYVYAIFDGEYHPF